MDMAMDDVTLVIARADDDLAVGVARLLSRWSQAGLVRPFLWWHSRGEAGHLVRANDEQDAEPMLKAIGTSEYSTVRLVSLIIAADAGGDGDASIQELATEVEEVLVTRLGAGQRLARVNLIVPASGTQALPATLLNSRWDVNLVVADEDRPTPLTISQEVRDPDLLVAHTAAALATVAGLWPGARAGPFDELSEGGQQEPRVRVVRSFVRLLRCHDLVDGVTRQILDLRENPQWLADSVNALPAEDPSMILGKAIDQFFAGPGARLARQPASPPPAKPLRILTPRQAFLELWRFVVALGRRTPSDIADYTKDRMLERCEQFAQDVVFGKDSTAKVRIGTRTLLAERDNAQRLSPGATEFADALLSWLGSHPSAAALGAEWGSLKGLSFGMVDAGKLPDGIDEPEERTRRLVVIDIDLIAPDPSEEPFEFQSSEPAGAEPDNTKPAADARPVRYQVAACDPAGAAQADSRLAPETPDRERFDSWLDQRKGSLLWRVGERIAADAAVAESALVEALESIARPRDDPGAVRHETSRMYLSLTVIAVIAVAAVVVGAVLWAIDVITLPTAGAVTALSVTGWLLLSLLVFYPYARRQFRRANALLKRFNEDEAARVVAEHEAGELLRLAAAYKEYLDWAVIIGSVLHRPGGSLDHQAPEPDPADLDLPDAVGIGAAETDLRQCRRLAAIVGRRHFHPGWMSGLLIDLTSKSMEDLKYEKGEADNDPTPEPEIDRRARARLRDDLMSGLADTFGQRIRENVARNVIEQPLDELFSGLRAAKNSTPHKFLTVIWERPPSPVRESFSWPLWRLGRSPSEDTEYVWKPPAVAASSQSVVDVAPVVHSDGTVRLLWTARLDVSGPGLWSDLRIFEKQEPGAAETTRQSLDGVG